MKPILLTLTLLLFASQANAASEARCAEIDAEPASGSCHCAEAMQDGSIGSISASHNWTDSPAADECGLLNLTASAETVTESGMPPGNTIDRVLLINGGEAGAGRVAYVPTPVLPPAGTNRMCMRYYATYATDFAPVTDNNRGCDTERNKMGQFGWATHLVQLQETVQPTWTGSCVAAPDYGNIYLTNSNANNYTLRNGLSAGVTYQDCHVGTGWCRIEVCVSGDILAGTGISTEARITTLSDNDVYEAVQSDGGQTMGVMNNADNTSTDWYHGQAPTGTGIEGEGDFWVSHVLYATWDTDNDQWIGAASEIEGGAAAAPSVSGASITGGSVQ